MAQESLTVDYYNVFLDVYFNYYYEEETNFSETEIKDIRHKGESILEMLTEFQISEIKGLI